MAAPQTNAITDRDLTVLAEQFNKDDLGKLGESLGFAKAYTKLVAEDCDGTILRILTTWRNSNHSDDIDMRSLLFEKLREEFPEQAASFMKEFAEPVIAEAGVSEEFLVELAENIRTEELTESLARHLGFKEPAIERYIATNRMEGRVTSKGTRDMLYDWRDKTISRDQPAILKKSLINSGMARLAEDLPDITQVPEDFYSLSISNNLTVHGCRKKLIDRYKKSTCRIQLRPWDKEHNKDIQSIYTIVTMVKRDREGNELKRVVLKGSVDEIFSTTIDDMQPDRIILLAPAGKGKTTAVAKLAYDWVMSMKGSPLQDLPLLFVIKLRNVAKMMSLGEAIISQLLDDVDGLTPDSLEDFIEKNQEMCHIIMDGADEYAGTIKEEKGKPSNSLVRALQHKSLRNCRILVTSRPHLEDDFSQGDLPLVYAKMEIEGFTPEYVLMYIDKFFSNNEEKSNSLKSYLERNEVIKELTLIPFFTMMVCHLWSENLLHGITTQTALFDNVNTFFRHHLLKKGRELSDDVFHRTIVGLGKVALSGLLTDKNKLVFTPDDFRAVPESYEVGIELGLISSTTTTLKHVTTKGPTKMTTVEFYHKLAQEHAAGMYLATTYKEGWARLKYHASGNPFKKIQKRLADYENLLRFAAGAKDSVCVEVLKTILRASSVSDKEKYRILLDCSSESTDLSDASFDLVRRCIGDGAMILQAPTVHTAVGLKKLPVESKQQINRLHISASKLENSVASVLALSVGDLPNLNELSVEDNTSSMILKDGFLKMKSVSKEFLCVFAGLQAAAFQKIWRLDISGINSCWEGTNLLLPVTTHCSNVNELNISIDEGGDVRALIEGLHPDLMKQLRTLRTSVHRLPEDTKNNLASVIGSCESLDEFEITIAGGSDHEASAKMYGDGSGQFVLMNPTFQLLDTLSELHENMRAVINDIRIHILTLPLDLANKIASFIRTCANMTDVEVHIEELVEEPNRSTLLSLHSGILHMNPTASLVETFQSVVAGFHQRTMDRVTNLQIRVPRMTAPAIENLKNSIGRCVNITNLFVDADGDDVHAIMRRLHQDTLSRIRQLQINLEQRSAAGIGSLASIIGRFRCIQELDISYLTYRGERKFLTLNHGALTVQSPTMHPILSNLHPDVLKMVYEMLILAGEPSPLLISKLSATVCQCSCLINLIVYGVDEWPVLHVCHDLMWLNLVSKAMLPIMTELPLNLVEKVLHIEVTASDMSPDVATELTRFIRMFYNATYLSVAVSKDTGDTETLTMIDNRIKLTCPLGQLLSVWAELTHGNITAEGDILLSVPQLTDTIAEHVASALGVLSTAPTVSIVVGEGTVNEVFLSLRSGELAMVPLAPTLLPLLKRMGERIFKEVNAFDIWAPEMTEGLASRLTSLSEMSSNLQAVALHKCTTSDVEMILNALHGDVISKIEKLRITCTDPLPSFSDNFCSAMGRFLALDEFHLRSEDEIRPHVNLEVEHKELSVTGPTLQALMIAASFHQETLEKVSRLHISKYSPDESSMDLLTRCAGMCSNITKLAFDVASGDDVQSFMQRLDQNTLAKIENLQVLSPDLPTPLAVQLSSTDRWCPSICYILVSQTNEKRRHRGPPADLPVVHLQGNTRLTIRICSEDSETVLVKTEPFNISALLQEVQEYSSEKVQMIMISAPLLTLSVAEKLGSFIVQYASISSLFIRFSRGTGDEASVSVDRQHLRLKNMTESMIPILAGLHESIKDEICTLEISETSFQPELSHRWPFVPSLHKLSSVAIEKCVLNLHGSFPSLLTLIWRCNNLTSMRRISIWQCGTDGLDRLESYVDSLSKNSLGMEIDVRNVSPHYTFQRSLPCNACGE